MRTIITFMSLMVGFALQAAPPTTNEVLHASQYAAAEVIYRSFLPGAQWPVSETNSVYCLSFGSPDEAVPSDFMAHFPGPLPRVITGTNGLIFPKPGVILERESGRKVVRLMLCSLSSHGGDAEARLIYATGSETVTETLQLAEQDGRWKITRMTEEKRAHF
jgi:hypothetical protein